MANTVDLEDVQRQVTTRVDTQAFDRVLMKQPQSTSGGLNASLCRSPARKRGRFSTDTIRE